MGLGLGLGLALVSDPNPNRDHNPSQVRSVAPACFRMEDPGQIASEGPTTYRVQSKSDSYFFGAGLLELVGRCEGEVVGEDLVGGRIRVGRTP